MKVEPAGPALRLIKRARGGGERESEECETSRRSQKKPACACVSNS